MPPVQRPTSFDSEVALWNSTFTPAPWSSGSRDAVNPTCGEVVAVIWAPTQVSTTTPPCSEYERRWADGPTGAVVAAEPPPAPPVVLAPVGADPSDVGRGPAAGEPVGLLAVPPDGAASVVPPVTGAGVTAATVTLERIRRCTSACDRTVGRDGETSSPTSPTPAQPTAVAPATASTQPPTMAADRFRMTDIISGMTVRIPGRGYGDRVTSILIVEDDARIRDALQRALTRRGHDVRIVETGLAGLQAAVDDPPEVVVLDLGLPDVEGRQLLVMLRAVSQVPVIVATARDDELEMVRTLDAGADDYIVKPYSADQLEARMRAVLRRSRIEAEEPVRVVGALTVDPTTRVATVDGRELDLTKREFDLLNYLAARAGRVVSKRQLMADVWNQPYGGADKTIDVHVSWLRRKLGETAAAPRFITTLRGAGVKLADPDA